VLPQKIESALREDGFILQAAVFGHGRDFLTALIVPDFEPLERHLLDQGISFPSREELVADVKVMELMELRIAERFAAHPAGEKPVAFALLSQPFSYEHGELTILGSVRRQVIGERHAALLESLYR
jgi:long-chain acyl-CoA synthetase